LRVHSPSLRRPIDFTGNAVVGTGPEVREAGGARYDEGPWLKFEGKTEHRQLSPAFLARFGRCPTYRSAVPARFTLEITPQGRPRKGRPVQGYAVLTWLHYCDKYPGVEVETMCKIEASLGTMDKSSK
jgi:hypothetical protein